ncbi:hypothetical protein HDU96_000926 [Phlyctochytrium bullatum]|nr:hypothetical protein HDU96_000926 [Phlyctochytrium bullatum]
MSVVAAASGSNNILTAVLETLTKLNLTKPATLLRVLRIGFKTAFVALGVVPFAATLYLYVKTRKSAIKGLKQPPPKAITGNLSDILKNFDRRHEFFYEWAKEYGPTWTITTPNFIGRQHVFTVDPAVVEYALKTNFENFEKGPRIHHLFECFLGDGIFNTDGEHWKWQRKLSSHIFTGKNFREVVSKVFHEDIENLVTYLHTVAGSGRAIDLHRVFHALTLDTFGKIAYGTDLGVLADPENPPAFSVAFDTCVSLLVPRLYNPYWFLTAYFDGSQKKLKENLAIVEKFAAERIAAKRKERAEGTGARKDLMDLFFDAAGGELEDKKVRDMVFNMTLAGRDTTAQTLSWAFLELTKHPEIVDNIRHELDLVLGDPKLIPEYEQVPLLKYTNAFIMEILRLYPSVPVQTKASLKEDVLPGGIKIPANTEFRWFSYSMGRMENLWGPDALEIKPSRWLDFSNVAAPETPAVSARGNRLVDATQATLRRESPFKWIAFNAGPRTCLGQQMATVEMVMALSAVVGSFEIVAPPEGITVTLARSFTLQMGAEGLRVLVEKRA